MFRPDGRSFFIGNEITQSVDVLNMGGQIQYILSGEDFHISRPSDITLDNEKSWIFVTDSGRVLVFDK